MKKREEIKVPYDYEEQQPQEEYEEVKEARKINRAKVKYIFNGPD